MRRFTTFVLSTVSVAALAASPAFAQAPSTPAESIPEDTAEGEDIPPSSDLTNAQGEPVADDAIIITGSRIRRDNFSTAQNVDILTRDDQVLAGTRSPAETLQSATVTSGTSQISGSFLGFLSEGGQAANTIGLRGLGAQRTLVLLNGRRLSPAGSGNQLVSSDLNVLPSAVVQRIEILREGASSIYGSDAIAGVINLITDTKVDGVTLDFFTDQPVQQSSPGGRSYRASVVAGKTFDRGYITGALEYRTDTGMEIGDRDEFGCPRELAYVNGVEIGQGTPDDPNELRCWPFERGGIGTASGYGLAYQAVTFNPNNPSLGFIFRQRLGLTDGSILTPPLNVNNYDLRPEFGQVRETNTVFSPITTYTGFLNGAYELEALGNAELYGEALFTRRESKQRGSTQLNFRGTTSDDYEQFGGAIQTFIPNFPILDCEDVFGDQCSPFWPDAWSDAGINYFDPFIVPDRPIATKQNVDFFRGFVGLRGSVGIGDWAYDGNLMISRTRANSSFQWPTGERINNILSTAIAPAGMPEQYTVAALPGQAGAGNVYTCASNLTDGAYNGGTCVPINYFDPDIFVRGNFSNELFDYLYDVWHEDSTKYNQETFNVVFDGSLFELPGGTAKAAFGFEHRRDFLDHKPPPSRTEGIPEELIPQQYSIIGRTIGKDRVNEVFGELQLPLLKDRPFVELLEVTGSARYTHYKSYGSDITYSFSGQWAPNNVIRFRGNFGTNFRAPNLYEQFVADEVGFYPGSFDPCDEFGSSTSPGSVVYEKCLAELTPILDDPNTPENEALDYFTSGGIQVTTRGGAGVLEAETAKTWGFGTVITAPRHIADLSLAVDFWNINVKGEVGVLGNLILFFCYSLPAPDSDPYCNLINGRYTDTSDIGQIISFENPYLNISQQIAKGIDFDLRYATRLWGGRFSAQAQATRFIDQKLEFFEGSGITDFNGDLGYPNGTGGPRWVASLDLRYTTAKDITFRWGVNYVGKSQDVNFNDYLINSVTGDTCTTAGPNCVTAEWDLTAEPYWEHGASVQWLWRDVGQFTFGVKNLFNEEPPTVSLHPDASGSTPRLGNWMANGPYDYRGRSFFLNVTRSF